MKIKQPKKQRLETVAQYNARREAWEQLREAAERFRKQRDADQRLESFLKEAWGRMYPKVKL